MNYRLVLFNMHATLETQPIDVRIAVTDTGFWASRVGQFYE